ncbi:MAG: FAD-dependent oxidoreductase [Planctomycetes bacterium]|nr:FAD-dependent oxidoreductase [Planctomycetota bacterium]
MTGDIQGGTDGGTFSFVIRQLVAPAGENPSRLPERVARKLGVPAEDIAACTVVRRSFDARRRRGKAVLVYHVRVVLANRWRRQVRKNKDLDIVFEAAAADNAVVLTDPAPQPGRPRPLVVGAGPAGLFAALRLARAGWKPILIDRGDSTDDRSSVVAAFWRSGVLQPDSNVLYGAGGAGLFSDGKLNTRHKDRDNLRILLQAMVQAGAPESILIDAEPHVGSDVLLRVVENLLREISDWGGTVRFRTRLDRLVFADGRVREALLWNTHAGTRIGDRPTETVAVDRVVLATGHSARDVYEILHAARGHLDAKAFAVGVRGEMPQEAIDRSQRSGPARPVSGGAAAFRLSRPPTDGAASCYTFCMCPGGLVIPCASEPGRLAVNGMSYHARAGEWGNAAFLTPVTAEDFADCAPADTPPALAGIAFQRYWEERAYRAGLAGGAYAAPAALLEDFVLGRPGPAPDGGSVSRVVAADFRNLLPERVYATLAEAVPAMLGRLHFVKPETVRLYGIETRTSSPVRVLRNKRYESSDGSGLFPAGEGSGYAGGIMTSALDGWKAAGCLMSAATRQPAQT